MAKLTVELSEHFNRFKCDHCGEDSVTVWGFVAKDGRAHAVYYANMVEAHPELEVRMTVSIGNWGADVGAFKLRIQKNKQGAALPRLSPQLKFCFTTKLFTAVPGSPAIPL